MNKSTGKVSSSDIRLVSYVKVILGSFVSHINDTTEAIDLTIKLKKSIEFVCKTI